MITRNSVRCSNCNDEIESTHRHDFRWCSCGNVAVDGGRAYRKRVYTGKYPWEDTSTFVDKEDYE